MWFLITVEKKHVLDRAVINRLLPDDTSLLEKKCEAVLGEYKHSCAGFAIQDAAKAHNVSPLALKAYPLQD